MDRTFRVGNGEREAVAEILRTEHLNGRLDNAEFDQRLTLCLAAKTYADLDELITDFPVDETDRRRIRGTWLWWPLPLLLLPFIAVAIVLSHGRAAWLLVPFFFWFVLRPLLWGGWRGYGWRHYGSFCWPHPGRRRSRLDVI